MNLAPLWALALLMLAACASEPASFEPSDDPLAYVNPFIGTGGHGHTYPGASRPFGMVQLSPDTRLIGWDGCSGYHFSDSIIYGFSHTHLSGTGVSDYGDILLMPVNDGAGLAGRNLPYETYQSGFSHAQERATAGFYEVFLERPGVDVALTATPRGGLHRYRFRNPRSPAIVLDLEHRDEVLGCDFEIVSNNRIQGYRHSRAWAEDQRLFFVIEFSEPFVSFHAQAGAGTDTASKGLFLFPEDTDELYVKVAISAVDVEGAHRNFMAELQGRSFEEVLAESEDAWRQALGKIEATALNEDEQTIFYTSLYHTLLAPNIYNDVDGRYRGMDQQIHQEVDRVNYTVFSLWDTHRALHPLLTIMDQARTSDFVNCMLRKFEQGGILPIWDLSACYTGCMIGYHGVSVIADAYGKGIRGFDAELALAAMRHSAEQEHLGLGDYRQQGFIAMENEAESVSKTLEYAYDDWCIAQMAAALGKDSIRDQYLARSLNYRNLYDPETGFFRPRGYNFWKAPFDPFEVNSNYTEANAWQYGFSAVHDIEGFARLHGGRDELDQALDALFSASTTTKGREQADITGLIGQYAHGNEPSHHIAYLYNYVGKPWKTQARVREILSGQYQNAPDGISGNEDCGQMSAWYVLSAMGFYAVLPGSDYYVIGSPSLQSATIRLENGREFLITTEQNSAKNVYIQSVTLNGEAYDKSYLLHQDIMAGGRLHFVMGPTPRQEWGSAPGSAPVSAVEDAGFVQAPYLAAGDLSFADSTTVVIDAFDPQDQIYCSLDGGPFTAYQKPGIVLHGSANICTYVQRGGRRSATLCTDLYQRDVTMSIELINAYADMYDGGAPDALIDGLRGGGDYRTGRWQGFEGQHLEAIVDLHAIRDIHTIATGFLQDENSWIFFPTSVEYLASEDGENFHSLGTVHSTTRPEEKGVFLEDLTLAVRDTRARYIKVRATSLLKCPPWHKGAEYDGKAWVFADEIMVE
ncbi:MAG: GH92 family glycosyl hydrolase [Lewinella sp.]|nr:GH92 family glycosyl hydrolase [Lewinella sp.]